MRFRRARHAKPSRPPPSTGEAPSPAIIAGGKPPRGSWAVLLILCALFIALRAPHIYKHWGGLDEMFYAPPGYTVARTGVPKLPYYPGLDRDGFFLHAERAFFAIPPGYFYWQAPWHWLVGRGYTAARCASALSGIVAIWFLYLIGRNLHGSESLALWGAALWSISRVFYFPATLGRPDTTCTMFCLASAWAMTVWHARRETRWGVLAGICGGLAVLVHPAGVVAVAQVGLWIMLAGRGVRRRVVDTLAAAGGCLAALSLWLPMIVAYPEEFRTQFINNVVKPTAPGLVARLVAIGPVLRQHFLDLLELSQPIQLSLMGAGVLVATACDLWRPGGRRAGVLLFWSSYYLLNLALGSHRAFTYWCFPAAYAMLCVARTGQIVTTAIAARFPVAAPTARIVLGAVVVALMLPGMGIRTFVHHLAHRQEAKYDHVRFIDEVLRDLPADATHWVEPAYALDVWLAGRRTYLLPYYYPDFPSRFDYLVVGRQALDLDAHKRFGGERIGQWGDRDDPFSNYVEVYAAPRDYAPPTDRPVLGEPVTRAEIDGD